MVLKDFMASDRRQFNRALARWDTLHDEGAYSAPDDEGYFAILWSDTEYCSDELAGIEAKAFEKEAHEIAYELSCLGIESRLFPAYTLEDAAYVLGDPEASSVVTISNGNLSASYAHGGGNFDWKFVSEFAEHLKTGKFIQRHCGQAIREMSVPLGTFALSRHSNVYAAHDHFLPTTLNDDDEKLIKQLHPYPRIGYATLKSLFPSIPKPKPEDDTSTQT